MKHLKRENILLIQLGVQNAYLITVNPVYGAQEVQELVVENDRKEYKITTDIKEIDGIKGGNISGEDAVAYEKIKYGDNSTRNIVMTPNENYEIIEVTVNGEEWQFEPEIDGSYTMPAFQNIQEDKHIVVTYSLKDNKITINKKDGVSGAALEGAQFRLDQIEERIEPDNNEIIGDLQDNGTIYTVADYDKEVVGFFNLATDLKYVEGVSHYFVPKTNEDNSIYYCTRRSWM